MAKGIAKLKLNSQALKNLEEIKEHCLAPDQPRVCVEMEDDREKAIYDAQNVTGIKVAVDCSCKNNLIGVGVSYGGSRAGAEQYMTVGYSHKLSVYLGELDAIQWAVETLVRTMNSGFAHPTHVTIFSDSQAALKALREPACQSGQWLLRKITLDISTLEKETGHTISVRWVSGHSKVDEMREQIGPQKWQLKREGCLRKSYLYRKQWH